MKLQTQKLQTRKLQTRKRQLIQQNCIFGNRGESYAVQGYSEYLDYRIYSKLSVMAIFQILKLKNQKKKNYVRYRGPLPLTLNDTYSTIGFSYIQTIYVV